MFLALFFHPKDYHCIHLDAKVNDILHLINFSKLNQALLKVTGQTRKAVERLVSCYAEMFPESKEKVFISKESIQVFWGHMSVLDADLICLRELRVKSEKWLHAATLAGTGNIEHLRRSSKVFYWLQKKLVMTLNIFYRASNRNLQNLWINTCWTAWGRIPFFQWPISTQAPPQDSRITSLILVIVQIICWKFLVVRVHLIVCTL